MTPTPSTPPPPARERYHLELEPLPRVDGVRALRRLLKYSLRACGMRAKLVAPLPPATSEVDR